MLSQPAVYQRLASHFVGLRFDWEQGNYYKERVGFILGTGDQLLLDPRGEFIPNDKGSKVYGRHGCDTTPAVLDTVISRYPPKSDDLRMEWFWWASNPSKRPGGLYPVSHTAIAAYARLPIATVEGPLAPAFNDPKFLRWHLRQFIWVRGLTNGSGGITIQRVKDGLKPGLDTQLAVLDPNSFSFQSLGERLDEAWNTYMKDRPLAARGYLENPHGGWMRSVKDQMLSEESEIRRRAAAGTLLPPGRKPGEKPPYL